ncbi:MAG TPA: hypoxanthine phosphoribosyltransferase [bacterium]|nr:hypoxanthine phosphoribosyltransferase [bacterium]HMW37579.1 hypoxanthine phosphoribosyltransferase [bacterium]HMY35780.1 hypoxanthine phosphoribosyltransferase [bacterium]HMZ04830.1 hypoxanthine phosphoribosyltransferase [bacterium]HNB08981.1 hypoxanthine phosphoribosyltransferase [bacterium]
MNPEKVIVTESHRFTVMISESEIRDAIVRLGKKITTDYKDKNPILVGVLNGSFLFVADLIREIATECEVDFLKIGSYGDAMHSSGSVRLDKDVSAKLEGRHVIVAEDIIDSGLSVTYIRNHLLSKKPASLAFASLLMKREKAKIDFPVEYVGFEIGNEFVIGYGLDLGQRFRHLKDIYVTKD